MLFVPTANKHVQWFHVLPAIGVTVPAKMPPFQVVCPLCKTGRLAIYKDTIFGGNWHYCLDCGSTGDLVGLAMKVWNTDLPTARMRLIDNSFDSPCLPRSHSLEISDDRLWGDYHTRQQEMVAKYLAQAARNVVSDHPAAEVLASLRLNIDNGPAVWLPRMGRYLGISTKKEALASIAVRRTNRPFRSMQKITNFCVIPFYDLPFRVSGLLFLAKNGYVIASWFAALGPATNKIAESGFAMLDTLFTETADNTPLGNTTIVCDNALLAVQLQNTHMRDHSAPLPLIATYGGKVGSGLGSIERCQATCGWDNFPHRDFIFWGKTATAHIINAAASANGKLYIGRVAEGRQYTPQTQLAYVQEHAQHWERALGNILQALPPDKLALVTPKLNIPRARFMHVVRGLPKDTRDRVLGCDTNGEVLRAVVAGGERFCESQWRTYCQDTGECVLGAVLRIDQVISNTKTARLSYRGRVLLGQNDEVPFVELAQEMDANAGSMVRDIVSRARKQLIDFDPKYSKMLTRVARVLKPPEYISCTGRVGWDMESNQLVLPNFTLTATGKLVDTAAPIVGDDVPARCLQKPTGIPVGIVHLLQNSPANQCFWATAACVAANVLGPIYGWSPSLICVTAQTGAAHAEAAALALGCVISPARGRRSTSTAVNQLWDATQQHGWPVMFEAAPESHRHYTPWPLWLYSFPPKNAMVCVHRDVADSAGLYSPVRIIHHAHAPLEPAINTHGSQAFVWWLYDLARRSFTLASEQTRTAHAILDDMAKWATDFGQPDTVLAAKTRLIDSPATPGAQAERLLALICRHVRDLNMRAAQQDFGPYDPCAMLRMAGERNGIFISHDMIANLLVRLRLPPIAPEVLTAMFVDADALIAELEYNGYQGWLIAESWVSRGFGATRQPHAELRIVS